MRTTLVVMTVLAPAILFADDTYQKPPKAIANLVDAPPLPSTSLGPDRVTLLLSTSRAFPTIAEVAEPELRLAGLRINPKNRAISRRNFAQKLELLDTKTKDATPRQIRGIPDAARI